MDKLLETLFAVKASSVFIVDDEHVIAYTLKLICEINGYRARFFTSPLEALQAARAEAPDLLLSDVMMPEISGIDLAIAMTHLSPKCEVLLLSGQATTGDMLRIMRAKGYDFRILPKPIPPQRILAEIGKLVKPPSRPHFDMPHTA